MNYPSIVVVELVLALGLTAITVRLRRRTPWVFLLFPLLGATWAALGTILLFGSAGEVGLNIGFSLAFALIYGLPAGSVAGVLAFVVWLASRNVSKGEGAAKPGRLRVILLWAAVAIILLLAGIMLR